MAKHRVYLIPGFFGFTHMGEKPTERIVYFEHVRDVLVEGFQKRGHTVEVEAVTSHPTANLQVRAQIILRATRRAPRGTTRSSTSSGTPPEGWTRAASCRPGCPAEAPAAAAPRAHGGGVSTPHYGDATGQLLQQDKRGEMLLRLLWLFTVFALRRGSRPMTFLAFRLFYSLSQATHQLGFQDTLADQVTRMLAHLTPTELATLEEFLAQVGKDQSLIDDLTPGRMEGFNRETPDQPNVRYGSVITGAPPPSLKGLLQVVTGKEHPGLGDMVSLRMMDPEPQVNYGAYSFLYKKSAPEAPELRTPEPTAAQDQALRGVFGEGYRSRSDGIAPTRSQVWGQVIAVAVADHLDIIGHFDEPPEYVSWLKSGSHFRSPQFQGVWNRVLDFMVGGR